MTVSPQPARVAIIGVSGYGSIHLQLARESRDRGEIKITAAAIINPQDEAATVAELVTHFLDSHTPRLSGNPASDDRV